MILYTGYNAAWGRGDYLRWPVAENMNLFKTALLVCFMVALSQYVSPSSQAQEYNQPLASNAMRLLDALESLGRSLPGLDRGELQKDILAERGANIERAIDPYVLAVVTINPESKVKAQLGAGSVSLQQHGFTPCLIKIINQGRVKSPLRVQSPQAGPSYSGVSPLSGERQDQHYLRENEPKPDSPRRFLELQWYTQAPMTVAPSGAEVEYAVLNVYTSDAGQREAIVEFSVGQGTQDLGFRAQVPILFECKPAIPVTLRLTDDTCPMPFARITIRDQFNRVYPSQVRRLAPDFFFQEHIYRRDGETILLPPGDFTVESMRGPEYERTIQKLHVAENETVTLDVNLKRWVLPSEYGWYSGDHHIHGAGCAHYENPTQGVTPEDMFRQVSGEGLNVGCVLTWGPCFEFQRQFFRPDVDRISRADTIMKYDLEVSGFGSQALGHVCLLNLKDQEYPGSEGTKEKGWPTWTTPVLRWAKAQGAVTGFAHSASGLEINAENAAGRALQQYDANQDQLLSLQESQSALLPDRFEMLDRDHDEQLSRDELRLAIDDAAERLPNLAVPEMDSVGAMELPVAMVEGVCDFISAMDTPRIAEWNMWYHLLNCGFPLKASGETDFPCMSGTAVGQGRSYVYLGEQPLTYDAWCNALAAGRSYLSDGYAHILEMNASCDGQQAEIGGRLVVEQPQAIKVSAKVSFAPATPESIAHGTRLGVVNKRWTGDTVTLHGARSYNWVAGGSRQIELIVNGQVIETKQVAADGEEHQIEFTVQIEQSSWIAVRCFPQLHSNPIEVLVGGKPIRASAQSARWCEETIHQLWRMRSQNISVHERADAEAAFQRAISRFRKIADES